ncbi:MAG: SDR family oxidoreductase [Bauldia sp.]|nr:SDR family oxidoreductase [Bauldia sp.]
MPRTVVITGGSGGIGAAVARLAGARGWNVAFNFASNAEGAAATAEAVEKAGGRALSMQGDVAVEADVLALFDAAEAAFGRIDGVVNNAGMAGPPTTLADIGIERLRRVIDVNVLGAFLVAREGVRRMGTKHGGTGGAIVNISSAAARLGAANERVEYAGSKGAIDAMTVGLGREAIAEGVRVNAVRPGLIETDIHVRSGQPGRAETVGAQTPIGRPGTAEEVAEAVMWLLSEQSSYVTGTILDVTGGR